MKQFASMLRKTQSKWFITAVSILLLAILPACGGAPAEEEQLSEAVPPRRGTTVQDEVVKIIAETLEVAEETINDDDNLWQDLGADNEEMAQLAEALEAEFDIDISDEELMALTTVRSTFELVESK